MRISIAHSPDPDDAFMVYAIKRGAVDTGFDVELVSAPIDKLNEQAGRGAWDVTALSAHAYGRLHERYRLLPAGSSVGRDYGPVVVAAKDLGPKDLEGARVAVPGQTTTAFLVARLALPDFEPYIVDFKAIPDAVRSGDMDAGVVIHEGQMTVERQGLRKVLDLGSWWEDETGLPLPLGVNCVARRLPDSIQSSIGKVFRASIEFALEHRSPALDYAQTFGRGLDREEIEAFVDMYVNEDALELKDDVVEALDELYARGAALGAFDGKVPVDPVGR